METHEININSNISNSVFKSSFARSLSSSDDCGNSKTLELDDDKQLLNLNNSAENVILKNSKINLNDVFYSNDFLNGNGFNKSMEDKELWIITEKKKHQIFNGNHHSDEVTNSHSNDAEILRLRKECQILVEENRRLHNMRNPQFHECKDSVQNAVLQTKLETLEWQLKQVESSRDMYRAILEEVTRYLETCHTTFEIWHQQEQEKIIERSKSISCIRKKTYYDETFAIADERLDRTITKSSTNLTCSTPYAMRQKSGTLISELSYNAFKDFTWRRAKKSSNEDDECSQTQADSEAKANQIDIEKLSKQAFRLLRTVQNFLSTNEPILSQTTTSSSSSSSDKCISDITSKTQFESNHSTSDNSKESSDLPNTSDTLKQNESCQFHVAPKTVVKSSTKRFSTTDMTDESGFSSMSSFHEIGLPISEASIENRFTKPSKEAHGIRKEETTNDKVPISRQKVIESDENAYRVLWV